VKDFHPTMSHTPHALPLRTSQTTTTNPHADRQPSMALDGLQPPIKLGPQPQNNRTYSHLLAHHDSKKPEPPPQLLNGTPIRYAGAACSPTGSHNCSFNERHSYLPPPSSFFTPALAHKTRHSESEMVAKPTAARTHGGFCTLSYFFGTSIICYFLCH
jgi:hypothetical protein